MDVPTSTDGGCVFNRLPESQPQRQRRVGGAIVSTVVHLVFIALAVRATGLEAEVAPHVTPVKLIYVEPPSPQPATPQVHQPTTPPTSAGPAVPVPPTPVLPIIDVIEPGIPEPGIAIDPTAWERRGHVAAVASAGNPGTGRSPNASDGVMTEDVVDKPILAIPGTATPRYPSMLQSAGVEGDVRAQFVVDTLGRVEQGSIRILDTSHDLFASAVRDALSRARFKAAEAGGRRVRQLAEQAFTFRITR
jgi:periplasmic protein TonB